MQTNKPLPQPPQPAGQYGQYPPQPAGQYGQYPPQPAGQYGQYPPQPPQPAGQYGQYPPQPAGQYGQYPPQPVGQYGQYPPQPPQPAGQYVQYPPQAYPPQIYPNGASPPIVVATNCAVLNPAVQIQMVNGKITAPGSTVVGTNKGTFKLRIIKGTKLVSADSNGYSDPYVKIKSKSIESLKVTEVVPKNLNPVWESTATLKVDDFTRELLIIDVYDHDLVGNDDLLGFVAIDLSLLPWNIEVITTENLSFAKHGTIEIGITALDFGLTNIPMNYIQSYQSWRLSLQGIEKKEFKKIKKHKTMGVYVGKEVHDDYKLVCGNVKRRKNKRQKFAKGAKSVGKGVGGFILDAITDD